jgi:hypothetical protein
MAEYDRAYAEAATGGPPRFAPIVEKPVRTVAAYRARKAQAARRDVNEALRAYVEKQKERQE